MNSIIVEIRASEGGMDSKLLVRDFCDVYIKVAKKHGFNYLIQNDLDGIICLKICGNNVYDIYKNERGVHRVQRIPPTEKRGRVHTSAITVAVFDGNTSKVSELSESDIEFKTTRGTGKGGQKRNKCETCVVATHIPTGISCRIDTRSQYQGKRIAIETLSKRVQELEDNKRNLDITNNRRNQIGKNVGRGDKRRTYRANDDKVIDHITGKQWRLSRWMKGEW